MKSSITLKNLQGKRAKIFTFSKATTAYLYSFRNFTFQIEFTFQRSIQIYKMLKRSQPEPAKEIFLQNVNIVYHMFNSVVYMFS